MIEAYFVHLAIIVCISLILALSLQLALGFTGLINLGHIAFFAIGAYVSALSLLNGLPFIIALPVAGIVSMLFGMLLSLPTNRLKGDYLALATMAFTFVVYSIALNWVPVTKGAIGIAGIPKPQFFAASAAFLALSAAIAFLTYLIIRKIVNSPFGKVLEAIRDNELAVKVLGKDTSKAKSIALGISAFFAGAAGSLYASYLTFIDPFSFTIMQLIPILAIVIIGGLASLKGTVIATVILMLLPEPLRFIGMGSAAIGPARQIIYALILLLILIYRPKGFFGKVELDA